MSNKKHVTIKELDPDMIPPSTERMYTEEQGGAKIVVIGKAGTGKTYIINSLLYEKRHIFPVGMVFSGTEDSNHNFSKVFPPLFVYNGLDTSKLYQFIHRQKIARKYLKCPWGVCIIDDCTDKPAILRSDLFLDIYKNGRHWKALFILSMQYSLDVLPAIRTNIDGTFILREPNMTNREKLWKNYAGIIPDFSQFCDIMDQITDDHTALYIHNATTSNKLEDCVYWYKAKPVPDNFRFGCDEFWEYNNERYDEKYTDNLTN